MSIWKALGSVFRQSGQAVEAIGAGLQGGLKDTVSRHQTLQAFGQSKPSLGQGSFIAPNASVIGNVTFGRGSSIWYGAVLRGDVNDISIGDNTNIQDGAIIHVAKNNAAGKALPTRIGSNVTIGHGATVHAATIEDGSLVGMGATVLDGATVEKGSIVAAGAVVTPGKTVKSGQIWAGNPAKYLRDLEDGEAEFILQSANNYSALAAVHSAENSKTFEEVEEDKAKRRDRHAGSMIEEKGRSEENVRFRKEDEKLLRALLNKVKKHADAVDIHEAETSKNAELSALKEILSKYKVSDEDLAAILAWKHA